MKEWRLQKKGGFEAEIVRVRAWGSPPVLSPFQVPSRITVVKIKGKLLP